MDLSTISVDTTTPLSAGLIVVGGLAAIWGIWQVIKVFHSR